MIIEVFKLYKIGMLYQTHYSDSNYVPPVSKKSMA